jgi:hypothetical protein
MRVNRRIMYLSAALFFSFAPNISSAATSCPASVPPLQRLGINDAGNFGGSYSGVAETLAELAAQQERFAGPGVGARTNALANTSTVCYRAYWSNPNNPEFGQEIPPIGCGAYFTAGTRGICPKGYQTNGTTCVQVSSRPEICPDAGKSPGAPPTCDGTKCESQQTANGGQDLNRAVLAIP